jgi:hypothetical protein
MISHIHNYNTQNGTESSYNSITSYFLDKSKNNYMRNDSFLHISSVFSALTWPAEILSHEMVIEIVLKC